MILSLLTAVGLAASVLGEGDAQVIGAVTEHETTLLGEGSGALYGLQLTERRNRACQVRGFFRGEPPRAARFCSGRVVGRHVRDSAAALMGVTAEVNGLSGCTDRNGNMARVWLHSSEEDSAPADLGECTEPTQRVDCEEGWAVQGVQLYFDGEAGGRSHRNLRGIRPLCTLMAHP